MKLMLIDLNNIVYRFPYTLPNFYHQGVYTGGIFGFIKTFCSVVNKLKPDRVIVCDDHPPYKKYMKGYKEDRVKDFNVMGKIEITKNICLKFFDDSYLPYFKNKGYEADDVISSICDKIHNDYDEIIIVSNDSDLYQLFKYKNVVFWSKNIVYTSKIFEREYPELNELPYAWIFYQALCGGHNGLPKPKGIGDKTARKIVAKGTIEEYFPDRKQLKTLLKTIKLPYDEFALTENHHKVLDTIKKESRFQFSYGTNFRLSQHGINIDTQMKKAFEHLEKK